MTLIIFLITIAPACCAAGFVFADTWAKRDWIVSAILGEMK